MKQGQAAEGRAEGAWLGRQVGKSAGRHRPPQWSSGNTAREPRVVAILPPDTKAFPPPTPSDSFSGLSLVWAVGGAGQGHCEGARLRAKANAGHEQGRVELSRLGTRNRRGHHCGSVCFRKFPHGQRASALWQGFHCQLCNDHPKVAAEGWVLRVRPLWDHDLASCPHCVGLGSSCEMPGSLLGTLGRRDSPTETPHGGEGREGRKHGFNHWPPRLSTAHMGTRIAEMESQDMSFRGNEASQRVWTDAQVIPRTSQEGRWSQRVMPDSKASCPLSLPSLDRFRSQACRLGPRGSSLKAQRSFEKTLLILCVHMCVCSHAHMHRSLLV